MDEQNIAVTPNEEEVGTGVETTEEENAGEETGTNDVKPVDGLAEDGTQYSLESEEVIKYKELFPDVTDEAAIGSVISIHNRVISGENPAGDEAMEIADMIAAKLDGGEEVAAETESETGDSDDAEDGQDEETTEEETEEEVAE